MATRSRKEAIIYKKFIKKQDKSSCSFCAIDKNSSQYIADKNGFKIIRNIFPYSIWDDQKVVDHLMVVPKQHTDTLSDLKPIEAKEYVSIISDYEAKGYNLYARAPQSIRKTVVHQHTHLIKTAGPSKKFILAIQKPFFFRISM